MNQKQTKQSQQQYNAEQVLRDLPNVQRIPQLAKSSYELLHELVVQMILQYLFQDEVRQEGRNIYFLSQNPKYFWAFVRSVFKKSHKKKSKRTRNLFSALGFRTPFNKTAYPWIREQWLKRFGDELPEEYRPLYQGHQLSMSWLLLELIRPDVIREEQGNEFVLEPLFKLDHDQRFKWMQKASKTAEEIQNEQFEQLIEDPSLQEILNIGQGEQQGIGQDFLRLLHFDIGVLWPPQPEVLQAFTRFFNRLINFAQEVWQEAPKKGVSPSVYITDEVRPAAIPTYITLACPDWSYDEEGNFTFDSLGSGVGLVPMHELRAFLKIWDWLGKWGLRDFAQFKVIIADIEAYNDLNLHTVNETRASFLAKVKESNQGFYDALPLDMQLQTETMLLTEVLGGTKEVWDDLYENAYGRVEDGDWPDAQLEFDVKTALEKSFRDREALYRHWIKETDPVQWEQKARGFFYDQVAQHAVSGKILTDRFRYFMLLQGERNKLAVWWNVMSYAVVPVFYLQRLSLQELKEELQLT